MNSEKKLKDKAKQRLQDLKAEAEHLNVQLHLGAKEAEDEFEKQKKNLNEWLDATNVKLNKVIESGKESALKLKASLDELRVQTALGKAETKDALKEQQHKINLGLHNLKHEMNQVYHTSEDNIKTVAGEAEEKIGDFHTRFDLFRLQFHLGKEEAKDEWDQKKKDISEKLHNAKVKADQLLEKGGDKWEHFADEIAEAWGHIKNAFK